LKVSNDQDSRSIKSSLHSEQEMSENIQLKVMPCSRACNQSELGLDLEDAIVEETVRTLMQSATKPLSSL
jgi:hypothetical protein